MKARAIGKYAGAVILAIWVLFPMYLLTAGAFSAQSGVYQYPKSLWPDWSTGTMSFFWDSTGVPAALGRSAVVAAITLALSMLIGTPAGYAIARYRFRGRNSYQMSIVSTRAFPVVVLSIPLATAYAVWLIFPGNDEPEEVGEGSVRPSLVHSLLDRGKGFGGRPGPAP